MRHIKKLLLSLFLFLLSSNLCFGEDLLVHFIDVGYGDSILIEFADKRNILIDGGDQENGGKVCQYLKKRNIEKIDLLIATHPHPDHIGGLSSVIENFSIDKILTNIDISESKEYALLFKAVEASGIEFSRIGRGDLIDWVKETEVEVFHPSNLSGDSNNDSLVIKLTYGQVSFLFTADIGRKVIDNLIDNYGLRLKSNVLKVPHHGESGDSTLIEAVAPQIAVISTGPSKWPEPSEELISKYKSSKIAVLRTDHKGDIVIRTDGREVLF